jgi:type VI secretion system secreted protein Hcp
MSQEEANEIVRETQRLRRSRRALKLGLPTAAALGAGAALAVAAIPGGDGTITGCYANKFNEDTPENVQVFGNAIEPPGALRVINPNGARLPTGGPNPARECVPGESPITWNQSGPAGPQGPAGLPAVQSPAGPAGSQGPAGAPGAPLIGGTTFGLNNNAGETFLKLDGIIGGSTDKTHKQDIQIDSFSFGAQAAGTQSSSSGAGAGKASIQSFTITKPLDKASPLLLQAIGQGKTIKEADLLFCRKAGGEQQNYLEIKFSNVLVSSVLDGQSGGAQPTEQVTFVFQKASETFLGTKGAGPTISFNTGVNLKI